MSPSSALLRGRAAGSSETPGRSLFLYIPPSPPPVPRHYPPPPLPCPPPPPPHPPPPPPANPPSAAMELIANIS
eukprot:3204349-Pyramimonas_sp.AAC.1